VRPSSSICLAPATVGSTSSCYDACGPTCGNGIVESGEQCDDKGVVDGDGCSSTCQLELPTGCTSITAADYGAAFGGDEYFQRTVIRAEHLGYQPTLIAPIR
jgi:cysteine-rich repeat protein